MKNFDQEVLHEKNNNCFCESQKKGENRFVVMVDESQDCETIVTGHQFQEVFIDLSEYKVNNKEQEEDNACKDVKKQKILDKRGSIK